MFLPPAIMPVLVACVLAALLVHPLRNYVTPPASEDELASVRTQLLLREAILSGLVALLACLAWNVLGPVAERWTFLFGNAAALNMLPVGPIPVDVHAPNW